MADGFLYNSPFEAQFDQDRAQQFIIEKLLRGLHTCTLVKVQAVRPTGGQVGYVDVVPMVLDTDTGGVVIAQSPIFNVPYVRYQGGSSAVILDPAVDDTGLAMFAERDITNIKATLSSGAAATSRNHSSADGLYIGGVLNPDPTQWVKFLPGSAGIDVHTPGALTGSAGGGMTLNITGNASVTASGSATVQAGTTAAVKAPSVTLGNTGASLLKLLNSVFASWAATHTHSGVTTGSGTTGGPTTSPPAAGQTSIVSAE